MSELWTIIGANGIIGSALVRALESQHMTVQRWTRAERPAPGAALGHVLFAAGLTGDFRVDLLAVAQAHVCLLADVLEKETFASLTYLSSTRPYRLAAHSGEDAVFTLNPQDADHVYDLTKLTGESLCLNHPRATVRVVRLSNVMAVAPGSPDFMACLIRMALATQQITLQNSVDSCKDYIVLSDVVDMLPRIARGGEKRLYNLAGGCTIDAGTLAKRIAELTQSRVVVAAGASSIRQPSIDISRIAREFSFSPTPIVAGLEQMVDATRLVMQELI